MYGQIQESDDNQEKYDLIAKVESQVQTEFNQCCEFQRF
jgi:hypothetical protein